MYFMFSNCTDLMAGEEEDEEEEEDENKWITEIKGIRAHTPKV